MNHMTVYTIISILSNIFINYFVGSQCVVKVKLQTKEKHFVMPLLSTKILLTLSYKLITV